MPEEDDTRESLLDELTHNIMLARAVLTELNSAHLIPVGMELTYSTMIGVALEHAQEHTNKLKQP